MAFAAFYNAGQDCTAASRVIAHEAVYDEVVQRLAEAARGTTIGPLISAAHRDRVTGAAGGNAWRTPRSSRAARRPDRAGFFLEPTVVAGLRQDDELVQSEIFGPVITVQSFRDDDEALALANGVEQGLTASVWTRFAFARNAIPARPGFRCGVGERPRADGLGAAARRVSGHRGTARTSGIYGLDDYTRIKHIAHAPVDQPASPAH